MANAALAIPRKQVVFSLLLSLMIIINVVALPPAVEMIEGYVKKYLVFTVIRYGFSVVVIFSLFWSTGPPEGWKLWWRRFRSGRRLLSVFLSLLPVFLLYCGGLLWFGGLYQAVHRDNPRSFVFGSDIAASQSDRFLEETRASLVLLRRKKEVLSLLLNRLATDEKAPVKDCGQNLVCIEYKLSDTTLMFVAPSSTGPVGSAVPRREQPDAPIFQTVALLGELFETVDLPAPSMRVWRLECKNATGLKWTDWLRDVQEGDLPPNTRTLYVMAVELAGTVTRSIDEKEGFVSGRKRGEIWSYWDFVYFSGITLTTVGYGDILPNSTLVRMLVLSEILFGILLFVYVLNMVLSGQAQPAEQMVPPSETPPILYGPNDELLKLTTDLRRPF